MEATLAIVGLEIRSSLLDLLYGIDPNELAFVLLGFVCKTRNRHRLPDLSRTAL